MLGYSPDKAMPEPLGCSENCSDYLPLSRATELDALLDRTSTLASIHAADTTLSRLVVDGGREASRGL